MIRNFIQRLYSTKRHRLSLLGLDGAGKTTLLYQLKLQKVVQTIPTIGFNVEDVDVRTTSGVFSTTCWDLGTGCGTTYMVPLLKNMVSTSDGVVWLVDSADESYLEASVDAFKTIFAGSDGLAMDMPILILATKKDLPNIVSVDAIRTIFAEVLKGRPSFVVSSSLIQDLTTNKEIQTAFGWMQLMLRSSLSDRFSSPLFPVSVETPNEKLESWLTRLDTDTSSEVFLSQFHVIELPSWDHYTHIRIAYVLLTTYGRQKGKDMIFDGLANYILQSAQTRGRTFHVTMTYFWVQMVHFGIRSMGASNAESDTFARFLILNPYVTKGNLWAEYYSRDVMMSPKAKESMVLPDKKPLPNLVVQDAIDKVKVGGVGVFQQR